MNDYKEIIASLRRCYADEYWVQRAADAIEQLVKDNESFREAFADLHNEMANLHERNETLEKERDAAVADLHHVLISLGYDATIYGESVCRYCEHHNEKFGECQQDCNSTAEKWEWRGVQEDNT